MEAFTLSRREVHCPGLLKAACAGRVINAQIAAALGLSVRHVSRLKRRFEAAAPIPWPTAVAVGPRGAS